MTEAGRCPARDYISGLADTYRASITADLDLLGREGDKAPISKKPIKGHRGMWEVRTGGYRVFFVRIGDVFWVLGACKKQDQKREIAASATRMNRLMGG